MTIKSTITNVILRVAHYTKNKNFAIYCENKEVITTRAVAGIKSAYIKGKAENVPNGLEVTKPDMQQIFISLTSPSDERM